MPVDQNKLEALLKELPEELQNQVLQFAEALLDRSDGRAISKGTPPVRSFFGIWDSGDPSSADNDHIDGDLAREYAASERYSLE
jgi:hypothetical protein